ncbi:MAG: DMT family transporter [Pseudomonadota bacterium]
MRRPASHWLMLFALVAMWGSGFLVIAIAVRAFSPSVFVMLRLVLAAVLLTGLVYAQGLRFPADSRFWLSSLLIAVSGTCMPYWLITFGQQEVESGLAGILMGIMPLSTMAMAHFFVAGERLNPLTVVGFALGFAGLAVLVGPSALLEIRGQSDLLIYELAILGAAFCYATNAIIARHRPPADPQVAAAGAILVGGVVMLPLGLWSAPAELAAAPIGPLWALLVSTVVQTALGTVVFLRLVVVAGPSFTSFINYLIPVWAVLMGMIFLAERPGLGAFAALGLILGGIALSELGRRRASADRNASS